MELYTCTWQYSVYTVLLSHCVISKLEMAVSTDYSSLSADDSELQNIEWRVVIIDEAHRLKNRNCKLLEGLKNLDMVSA